eukprot:3055680-Rhodomonas_salina.2
MSAPDIAWRDWRPLGAGQCVCERGCKPLRSSAEAGGGEEEAATEIAEGAMGRRMVKTKTG